MHKHATKCVVHTHHRHLLSVLFWAEKFAGFQSAKTSVNKRFLNNIYAQACRCGHHWGTLVGLNRRHPTPNYTPASLCGRKVSDNFAITQNYYQYPRHKTKQMLGTRYPGNSIKTNINYWAQFVIFHVVSMMGTKQCDITFTGGGKCCVSIRYLNNINGTISF